MRLAWWQSRIGPCVFSFRPGFYLPSAATCCAQTAVPGELLDSDHDGLADRQEMSLLAQFEPRFLISRDDCSSQPAEFTAFAEKPIVVADNGTIYGQAFPRPGHAEQVELHYYDLWRRDCGKRGHELDAEHVSAVLSAMRRGLEGALLVCVGARGYAVRCESDCKGRNARR